MVENSSLVITTARINGRERGTGVLYLMWTRAIAVACYAVAPVMAIVPGLSEGTDVRTGIYICIYILPYQAGSSARLRSRYV